MRKLLQSFTIFITIIILFASFTASVFFANSNSLIVDLFWRPNSFKIVNEPLGFTITPQVGQPFYVSKVLKNSGIDEVTAAQNTLQVYCMNCPNIDPSSAQFSATVGANVDSNRGTKLFFGPILISTPGTWKFVFTANFNNLIQESNPFNNVDENTVLITEGDSDGDGLPDFWEMYGVDIDNDGIIELDLQNLGANRLHKDAFIEIDYTVDHGPRDEVISDVVFAFDNAPVPNPDGQTGITLHVEIDDAVMSQNLPSGSPYWMDTFYSVKQEYFGTETQRTGPRHEEILEAKNAVYRYGFWFVVGPTDSLGVGGQAFGIPSQDFIIQSGYGNVVDTHNWIPLESGVLMHEIGHTFGLRHGGESLMSCNPVHLSVMTSLYSNTWYEDFPLDYSRERLVLDENHLNENDGLLVTPGLHLFDYFVYGIPTRIEAPFNVPINWDLTDGATNPDAQANINLITGNSACNGDDAYSKNGYQPYTVLEGRDDWNTLIYDFNSNSDANLLSYNSQNSHSEFFTVEIINKRIASQLYTLDHIIKNLSDDSFKKPNFASNYKKLLSRDLIDGKQSVRYFIESDQYEKAIKKLQKIRAKTDGSFGGISKNDLITDSIAQEKIVTILDKHITKLSRNS
jgi:hypothetical protein